MFKFRNKNKKIESDNKRKNSVDSYINGRGECVEVCIDQYDRIVCFAPFGKNAERNENGPQQKI